MHWDVSDTVRILLYISLDRTLEDKQDAHLLLKSLQQGIVSITTDEGVPSDRAHLLCTPVQKVDDDFAVVLPGRTRKGG